MVSYEIPCISRTCWGNSSSFFFFNCNSLGWTGIYFVTSELLVIWALKEYWVTRGWWSMTQSQCTMFTPHGLRLTQWLISFHCQLNLDGYFVMYWAHRSFIGIFVAIEISMTSGNAIQWSDFLVDLWADQIFFFFTSIMCGGYRYQSKCNKWRMSWELSRNLNILQLQQVQNNELETWINDS